MKKVIKYTCFALVLNLQLLAGCSSHKVLGPEQYVQYLELPEHQYSNKQVVGNNEYTIQLATPEFIASREIEGSDDSAKLLRSRRIKELEGHLFFLIKIGSTEQSRVEQGGKMNSEQQLHADQMVSYYDQQAILDLTLADGGKSLKPITYLFENNYGLTPYNTIVVGFETGKDPADLTLNFNDCYTNTPAVRASFSKAQIEALPQFDNK